MSTGFADLHLHTDHSDGSDSPQAVVRYAALMGLDVIAVTDHDTITGAIEAWTHARETKLTMGVVIGEEISSADGHILGLFLSQLVEPGMTAAKTVDAIHDQGGLAIAAHPFWRTQARAGAIPHGVGATLLATAGFDAVEVYNAGLTRSMADSNRRAANCAILLELPAVGGSDAHVREAIGSGHTRFEGYSTEDLRRSLTIGAVAPETWPLGFHAYRRYLGWALNPLRWNRTPVTPASVAEIANV
ncbi:MAG TPA: CehA/McbA family metallohydrolase [Candidatus Dormibacteraeota bacterium]|jgi:hypothetical protein|nr:CehA/McbA family metallohydrolase [Candidatus Dormibacteraeota bacterium]